MEAALTRSGLLCASRFHCGLSQFARVAAAATTRLPGATRSGLSRLSMRRTPSTVIAPRVGPRELKWLTLSSSRASVALWLAAPTVMTLGSLPGEPMVP